MVIDSQTTVRQIDRKRVLFFGMLILLIMLIVSSVSGYLSLTLQRDEEDRLTRTIGTILSESTKRISFSGKYHTRLLLEELQKKLPEIAYISVETSDGIVEASTDSTKNNTVIEQREKALNRQVLEKNTAFLRERTIQNNPVKEVILPYRTGFETTPKGIIRIGIRVETTRSKQRNNLLFHILMIIILTVASVWIMAIISRYFSRRLTLSEQALRESENSLRTLVHTIPDLVWLKDIDGVYLSCNHAFERFFGARETDIKGRTDYDFIDRELADFFRTHDRRAIAVGKPSHNEEWVTFADDGHRALLDTIKTPMCDVDGTLIGVLGIGRDITVRKQAEEALRESRQRLDNIVTNSPGAIYRCTNGPEWTMEFLSAAITRITGYPAEDFLNNRVRSYASIIFPDDLRHVEDAVAAGLAHMEQYNIDYRIVAADGTLRWVHEQGQGVSDPDGRVLCLDGVIFDITAERQAEEALQKSEALLIASQHLAKVGGWEFDVKSGKSFWTEELYRIHEIPRDPAIDHLSESQQCYRPEDRPIISEAFQNVVEKGEPYDLELPFTTSKGKPLWIRTTAKPVYEDGKIVSIVGNLMDITDQKKVREELKRYQQHLEELVMERTDELKTAKEKAEAANRAKSIFLSNMSHELRTPLNAVLGFSQVMKNASDVTVEQRGNLDIITRSGEHLLNLINNVLDISKIESGRVALEESPIDLYQLLQEMQSLMHVRAAEKNLAFTLEQFSDLPQYVTVDGGKLRQVLINLIGNAIKYTKQGGVTLQARVAKQQSAEQVELGFEVADTGPGIRPEDQKRIFSPFVQLGDRLPTEAGSGLGLAICKQYVGLMGGTIGVVSEPEKGSVFRFEIPVAVVPAETIPAPPQRARVIGLAEGQADRRLLIAEDQPENRLLLRKLLKPIGFELREVVNGQEAVALFEQWRPHLIWMDMRMPVMDGLEATKRIKANEAGVQTRIIAVTAHALEEERREIQAAGCDGFIRKPYKDFEIFDALTKHLGVRFVYEEEKPPAAAMKLDAADLAELPETLRNALEQALVRIDSEAVSGAIEAIRPHNPSLADALAAVANDLQYGKILQLIKPSHGETSPEEYV